MGRKKIRIQSIKDDRNRQVKRSSFLLLYTLHILTLSLSQKGHFFKKKAWVNEESL
jgi:hypothetical protein